VLEEIEATNRTLIDMEITIAGDSETDIVTSSSNAGTTMKLSYMAVALSPDLRSLFASSEMVTLTLSTPCRIGHNL
jgi:PAX-interacting protein 1